MTTAAKRAKDKALDLVTTNAGETFTGLVTELVEQLPSGMEVTGEDIRLMCEEEGIEPHHHNAWGGTINTLVGDLLEPTGEHRPMVSERSHARKTPVYTVA